MSSGRQVADGFYLKRSRSRRPPLASQLEGLFDNLPLDFERRLTCKIFDVNRTLTALSSEVRRSVLIEDVPELVFERGMKAAMDGSVDFVVRTMDQLTRIVPPHSVVRKHYAGDFCIVAPILRCTTSIPYSTLQDLPSPPLTSNFSASKQEIFVALGVSPFSPHFLEVFSPFPGDGDLIDPLHYPQITVVCNKSPLVFSPCKPKAPDRACQRLGPRHFSL